MRTIFILIALSICFVSPRLAGAAPGGDSSVVRVVVNREYLPAALDLIHSARRSIRVIQYQYIAYGAVKEIERAVLDAAARGVDVQVLIDDTVRGSHRSVDRLARLGLKIKLDETAEYREPGDRTTHAKLIMADDERFLVGSTNFSDKSISDNNEANVLVSMPAAGRRVSEYFDRLWKDAGREPGIEPFRSADADVLFNRHYLPAVVDLFRHARKRIFVVLYGANIGRDGSDVRDLINEMKRAKKRGADVRVILDSSKGSFAEKTVALNREALLYMERAGLSARLDGDDVITHSKVLIVDDLAVVGGTNWGHGPLNEYNDINVIVRSPGAVDKLSAAFLAIWDLSPINR